ncbi:hypothetical protein GCM10011316_33120 [Roseibium aquae]|uniref:DUF427 domain-containing protein n=1 Tax=Roseibium aquae TaxID=1323746 RepID=A0A916X325_9HYPH|nr:DUF427 domain-containing protein [Roseibium aquae]GGB58426.1 hypothetical protein GCM10011316_33120 [Roseibium aquae]
MPDLPIEDVQSYPRPPALEAVPQRIQVVFEGRLIVDTLRAFRVIETHHPPTYYIPPADVDCTLRPMRQRTWCEWKGAASYFDVVVGGKTAPSAAWCYEQPAGAFRPITGYLAFYASKMDRCLVGDAEVNPQAGSFYGGWLTPNLRGTAKGAPGTEHW